MCIFTEDINTVHDTRIFARQDGNKQSIVYDMYLDSNNDTAMVLPIPIPLINRYDPDAVEFIDLSNCSNFFDDIEELFPKRVSASSITTDFMDGGDKIIEVKSIGAYEASYVPSAMDFKRLDPRFRLKDRFFKQASEYLNYSFVVFKLKPCKSKVHPIAFWFPKENDGKLFYPTKHMHNGVIKDNEYFSHILYGQASNVSSNVEYASSSDSTFVLSLLSKISELSLGIVSRDETLFKKDVYGEHNNSDMWLSVE